MVESNNQKKNKQLGMPHGTAASRLRKMLLFQLVRDTRRDICHQCGSKIETVDEFSIEHIEPWLDSDNPQEKFFDINNIAFSHLNCNIKASRTPHKIEWPEGQAWCWKCKSMKLLSEFKPSKIRRRDLECNPCAAKIQKERRKRRVYPPSDTRLKG